jgi:hypothetical protein
VPGFAEEMLGLLISFDMFDSPMDMTQIASTFNIKLASIEEFEKNMVLVPKSPGVSSAHYILNLY